MADKIDRKLLRYQLCVLLPIHLGFLAALAYFIINPAFLLTGLGLIFLSYVLLGGVGLEVGYHRMISHRAFECRWKWLERVVATLGFYSGQGSPFFWTALHNGNHHSKTETELDFYSPVNGGIIHVIYSWMLKYDANKVMYSAGVRVLKDPYYKFLHERGDFLYAATAIALLLINWKLAVFSLLAPGFIMHYLIVGLGLNWFGHKKTLGSYRRYETNDNTYNNWFWALVCFGDYHNNHHAKPHQWYCGEKWWEPDPGKWVIQLIRKK